MSKAVLVARILLGAMFLFFGMNHILHFLHMPPMPGDAGVFLTIMVAHHIMNFVALLQIIGGLLLLVGRFVPIALVLLGPVIVNILLFHLMLEPSGIAIGILAAVLELFLIVVYRRSFRGLFDPAPSI